MTNAATTTTLAEDERDDSSNACDNESDYDKYAGNRTALAEESESAVLSTSLSGIWPSIYYPWVPRLSPMLQIPVGLATT